MFFAKDKNGFILNANDVNTKTGYEAFYKCINCNDDKCTFIKGKSKPNHFRHSKRDIVCKSKYPSYSKYMMLEMGFYL